MTKYKYLATFSCNLCKAIPEVGKICDSVNDSMSKFGFNEKMFVRGNLFNLTLTVDEPIKEEHIPKVKEKLLSVTKEKLPDYEIELVSFELN